MLTGVADGWLGVRRVHRGAWVCGMVRPRRLRYLLLWLEVRRSKIVRGGVGRASVSIDHSKLLHQGLVSEGLADAGDIGSCHVITCNAGQMVIGAQPLLLDNVLETTLLDGVLGKLTHINRAEFVDLRC